MYLQCFNGTYVNWVDKFSFQNSDPVDPTVPYTRGYEDHLQIPLQPLMENLESNTYEVFEKDPVKYTEYQNAMYQALLDRVPPEEIETNIQWVDNYCSNFH